ncbi:MAG: hypothetical protein JNL66_20410 [Alphaproteobacteria bacterium]|nr:hypothetical protein [Alphaproteobacteria bacterium]
MNEKPPSTYQICPDCKWEDVPSWGHEVVDYTNRVTLKQGRANYRVYGICSPDLWEIYPEKAPPGWKRGSKP